MTRPRRALPPWLRLLLIAAVIAFALYQGPSQLLERSGPARVPAEASTVGEFSLEQLVSERRSGVMLEGRGTVVKVLRDDLDGSRHQRFILHIAGDQTLLISHNIDLAPRVRQLREGDRVEFYGQYEWNDRGGVIHWTHHDPNGKRAGGWIRHEGQTYR